MVGQSGSSPDVPGAGAVRGIHREIHYRIVRSRRRTLALHIGRDDVVEIRTPFFVSSAEALAMLRRHLRWAEGLISAREAASPPLRFEEGDTIGFLGERLTLRLHAGLPRRIERRGQELHVTLPPPATGGESVRRMVYEWFQERGREIFPGKIEEALHIAAAEKLPAVRSLTVRVMSSRWGSCSADGHVTLNAMLLQAQPECVDYVVMHELCHLREQNHSRRFYALLARYIPDWAARRKALHCVEPMP